MSAMRHRCERGRHEGVAQVDGGAPGEALLALEERDDEGQHGSDPWSGGAGCMSYLALHK